MNKVVCNLCGTSYPENAAQCPICGYARSAEVASSGSSGSGTYTYVKGGRFSKANVKKRAQAAISDGEVPVQKDKKSKKSGAALTIVVIVLLLAIVAVLGYVALRFFLPNNFLFEGLDNIKLPTYAHQEDVPSTSEKETTEAPTIETEPDLSCTAVWISNSQLMFTAEGAQVQLAVTLEPVDTIDELTFVSSDIAVATVSEDGTVTSVGNGTAVITVSCGSISAECLVTCEIPVEETQPTEETTSTQFSLNRKEITFNVEGQSWLLYDGDIPAADIVWSSDDNAVATIENGKVVAVANGDTTVYGNYNGISVSCLIHCKLDEEDTGESGGISEAGNEAKKTYKLYNPTGYSDDVTLNVGDQFTLKLVDEDKNEVTDAEWNIENIKICSYENNIVKALKSGRTEITATYEGVTYTCLVRVN